MSAGACFAAAENKTDNKEYEDFLVQSATEIDKMFGDKIEEHTVVLGADYIKDGSVNRFVYYYGVSPLLWDGFVESYYSGDEMKTAVFEELAATVKEDNDFKLFINILIEMNAEMAYTYICRSEYVSLVFSTEDLKQLNK